MIVVDEGAELLALTQPDHARFAAELLSLWRHDGLPEHPRRGELLFAVREHDNGWREADAAPLLDPLSGRPHDFVSHPAESRRAIWRRGIERFAGERPYAAALIVHHAIALHARHRGDGDWEELLAAAEALELELLATADTAPGEMRRDYRFLELADRLSLAVCTRDAEPVRHAFGSGRFRAGELALDPFPLAGATRFEIPCRRIPARRYAGDADLAGELATARWQKLRVRVVPGP